jgi:hypothetical protein
MRREVLLRGEPGVEKWLIMFSQLKIKTFKKQQKGAGISAGPSINYPSPPPSPRMRGREGLD